MKDCAHQVPDLRFGAFRPLNAVEPFFNGDWFDLIQPVISPTRQNYDSLFTKDKHIIFGFHGYPWLIHRLTYARTNRNLHVRGYKEEGTITTPFDMRVQNDLDRFHLVIDVVDRVPNLGSKGDYRKRQMQDKLIEHKHYIDAHGEDMPEIRNWKWSVAK
jgi:xylulose-5-phosphate/fructose-6-phosphate phosphoketolase